MTSKESVGGVRRYIIFLLILYLHLVTSHRPDDEEAAPPSRLPYSSINSCPNHPISQIIDALACIPPTVSPPPHDGGDLNPFADAMSCREPSTVTFAGVAVRAISASRGEEGKILMEVLLILIFPLAVRAIYFPEIPMRNFSPRFAQEPQLIGILFVNAITAVLLPAEWMWVPAVCCLSSLLILIVPPRLP